MTHDALAILESVKKGDPVAWEDFIVAAEARHDELLAQGPWHERKRECSEDILFIRREDITTV